MPAKQRLQAYVDPEIAEEVRRRAKEGCRPESWEVERIIRLGLQATDSAAGIPEAGDEDPNAGSERKVQVV